MKSAFDWFSSAHSFGTMTRLEDGSLTTPRGLKMHPGRCPSTPEQVILMYLATSHHWATHDRYHNHGTHSVPLLNLGLFFFFDRILVTALKGYLIFNFFPGSLPLSGNPVDTPFR
jgi:hypothetical protein